MFFKYFNRNVLKWVLKELQNEYLADQYFLFMGLSAILFKLSKP